jgi:hypothetical protein
MTTDANSGSKNESHGADNEAQLQDEVQEYLKEKERVRKILGRVGGNPGKKEKVMNILFLGTVALVFVVGLIFPEYQTLTLEVAILLVSLKLALILTQNNKMSHFQFWMLSTIEWRLSQVSQDMIRLKKDVAKMSGSKEEEKKTTKD